MINLNEEFLTKVGLGDLPSEVRGMLLARIYERLSEVVGEELTAALSDDQLDEFGAFLDQDVARTRGWLDANAEGWEQSVDSDGNIFDFACQLFLGLNNPDYREVVTRNFAALEIELREHQEAIRASYGAMDFSESAPKAS